jgi:hypothetical protein
MVKITIGICYMYCCEENRTFSLYVDVDKETQKKIIDICNKKNYDLQSESFPVKIKNLNKISDTEYMNLKYKIISVVC